MSDDFDSDSQVDINSPEFGENGKNKVKSISDAGQALEIARKLDWQDRNRDIRRARNLAAFNGAAPYSDQELIEKGQAYRYNVSFGFMEGVIGRALVPYNDLSLDIGNLTEIIADLPDEKLNIVQDEFKSIMDKWGKWPKLISRLNQDLVLNGFNNLIFPSDYDPFPVFIPQKDGFVDEGTSNDVNDLEVFVWKKSYLIHELYLKIADEEIAKKAGWNVKNVREALMSAQPEQIGTSNVGSSSGQWTQIESQIRNAALWTTIVGAKKIDTYHVFASEIDGPVSHWIVVNRDNSDKQDGPELFKKEKRFDSMRDVLVYFDLETGDGTWHGSRGVGQRVFNTHKAIDKIRCALLDQSFVSGLTILQAGDQVSQEELTLSVVGPFAVLPDGIQVATTTLPSIAATAFQMDALLSATSEQRVGDIVPNAQSLARQGDRTATEAKIAAGRQELITKGNLKRYVDPLSQVTSIIVRRLLKKNSPDPFAKEFQENLKKKGLTEEDIKKIRGARNTGKIDDILGDTAAGTQLIFQEFRGDPDVDQFKLKQKRISSVLDADTAEELLISDKDQTKKIEATRLQELEITTMQSGLKVPVSPRDNHEVHLGTLLEWVGAKVQEQAQQFDEGIIPVLKNITSHGVEHLGFLEKDPLKKQAFKEFKGRLKLSADAIQTLEKQGMQLAQAAFSQAAKLAKTPEEMQQVEQAQQQLQLQGQQ